MIIASMIIARKEGNAMLSSLLRRWRIRQNYKRLHRRMADQRRYAVEWNEALGRWAQATKMPSPVDPYLLALRKQEGKQDV